MKSFIIVKISLPGFHAWPGAPDEVAFLRAEHRHLFTFKATFKVEHDDRDREFFLAQRELAVAVSAEYLRHDNRMGMAFGSSSCEMIAARLLESLGEQCVAVEVWEDDESGGRVER